MTVETNFPEPVDEEANVDSPYEEAKEEGSVWATFKGSNNTERILTVADLKGLGDKEAEEPLIWNRDNRHILEITGTHPLVQKYIEEHDGGFTVERF